MAIPKVIHFCWLSGDPYPRKIQSCIDSWAKIMPDYQVKKWDTSNFDISSAPQYVQQAFAQRKWAFVADYIRMYALYTEGGIYLDSDVKVLKRFDEFLNHRFFSSLEYHPTQIERTGAMDMINEKGERIKDGYVSGIQIQAAVMGAQKGCEFCKDVLEDYQKHEFILPDGSLNFNIISPFIYAQVAEKYGFRYQDRDQLLADGMMIYRSEIFAGNKHEATPASFAIHYCAHSWTPSRWERLKKNVKKLLQIIRK